MKAYREVPTDRGTGVTCPRTDCGGKFVVNMERLLEIKRTHKPPIATMVCPYCSRVSVVKGLTRD